MEYLLAAPAAKEDIEKVTPAGSLRRGRETVGDLDMLVTGKACIDGRAAAEDSSSTCCASPA